MKIISFFSLLLCFMLPVNAVEMADRQFNETVTMPGYDRELKLNGIGIRYKFFFKIYVAALYLETKSNDLKQVIGSSQGKRMVMHFVYDEVEKQKLVNAWLEGFESNLPADVYQQLKPRIEQFNSLFDTAVADDVYYLDLIPGKGVRVSFNGQEKGIISGDDFYAALLKIWLGEEPVDEDLKQALSGAD